MKQMRPYFREEQCRAMKVGKTTQKAKLYLGDCWTSQSEQFLTLSLMKYHWEVSSEANTYLRRSRYSSPHLVSLVFRRSTRRTGPTTPTAKGERTKGYLSVTQKWHKDDLNTTFEWPEIYVTTSLGGLFDELGQLPRPGLRRPVLGGRAGHRESASGGSEWYTL